jgi:hypothetical protein
MYWSRIFERSATVGSKFAQTIWATLVCRNLSYPRAIVRQAHRPSDRVERWPIDRLVPYARNARTHSPGKVDEIAASMRDWGWTSPVLVDQSSINGLSFLVSRIRM